MHEATATTRTKGNHGGHTSPRWRSVWGGGGGGAPRASGGYTSGRRSTSDAVGRCTDKKKEEDHDCVHSAAAPSFRKFPRRKRGNKRGSEGAEPIAS